MSTVPPPYQYDPKSQRRAARAQAKVQRALFRQQTRHLRRGSMLGPFLLLASGTIAFVVATGRWAVLNFTAWYARWWPALLVVAGLILLAEWLFDQHLAEKSLSGAPPLRRRIGGGVVVLLILAAIFGATSRTVHDSHDLILNGLAINHDNLFELFSDKHDLPPQVLDQSIPALTPGLTLSVENPHGDINITGKSDDGNLHITVNKQVYSSDAAAQSRGDQLTPVYLATPNGLTLSVPNVDGGSADLTLLVPESLALSLTANRGGINVTGIKAPVILTANHGDVSLQAITGSVSARVNHSDSAFSAHNLTGDLTLKGNLGDVNLTGITGKTYMEGDFYGDTHLERLLGPVTFQTSRTHFTLARIDGDVDLDHSNISGSQLVGPIDLRVKSRDISLDRVSGDLDLTNSNGSVSVTSTAPGNLTINNTNGSIDLTVPDHANLGISAETINGAIDDDFALPTTRTGDRTTLTGTLGDGANHLTLETTHANISLHKGAPALPLAPRPLSTAAPHH